MRGQRNQMALSREIITPLTGKANVRVSMGFGKLFPSREEVQDASEERIAVTSLRYQKVPVGGISSLAYVKYPCVNAEACNCRRTGATIGRLTAGLKGNANIFTERAILRSNPSVQLRRCRAPENRCFRAEVPYKDVIVDSLAQMY